MDMDIEGISFLELSVGDIAHTIATLLAPAGFTAVSETDAQDGRRSAVFAQNAVTTLLCSGSEASRAFVEKHGDGVRDIAFVVRDVAGAFAEAVRRGAAPILEPTRVFVGERPLMRATVAGVGDVVHSFVDERLVARSPASSGRLLAVDHIAMCLEPDTLEATVDHYQRTFGFHVSHEEYVNTEAGGMDSKVVESPNGAIRFPLQQPAQRGRGQIADYLVKHGGPGVQHVAFLTDDILGAVASLEEEGVEFVDAPRGYYDGLELGAIEENLADLRRSKVLVDHDRWGYLMQIFTKSRHARRTLFFELIQRRNARGFGSGNIRALFRGLAQQT
jgi:4-hydroxymandelate synthase